MVSPEFSIFWKPVFFPHFPAFILLCYALHQLHNASSITDFNTTHSRLTTSIPKLSISTEQFHQSRPYLTNAFYLLHTLVELFYVSLRFIRFCCSTFPPLVLNLLFPIASHESTFSQPPVPSHLLSLNPLTLVKDYLPILQFPIAALSEKNLYNI